MNHLIQTGRSIHEPLENNLKSVWSYYDTATGASDSIYDGTGATVVEIPYIREDIMQVIATDIENLIMLDDRLYTEMEGFWGEDATSQIIEDAINAAYSHFDIVEEILNRNRVSYFENDSPFVNQDTLRNSPSQRVW